MTLHLPRLTKQLPSFSMTLAPTGSSMDRCLDGPLSVGLSGSFANGNTVTFNVSATYGAILTKDDDGVSGICEGSGFAFFGTAFGKYNPTYTVTINSPAIGAFGIINFQSAGPPPTYPCP